MMKCSYYQLIGCLILMLFTSCDEYLSVKPDKKLAIPSTPSDLQAILDMISAMNDLNPGLGEIGSDNFFLPYDNWLSIDEEENRDAYVWRNSPSHELYWTWMYKKIFNTNLVLDYIDEISFSSARQKKELYGQARFIRGMAFHKLTEVFAIPYDPVSAKNHLGIVLRLSSDINVKSSKSSLEDTYRQIILDLEAALTNLDQNLPQYPTRPSRAAAYGALARCYLSMRQYELAGLYADSCLAIKSNLLDYNTLVETGSYPFERYNEEVIYHSRLYAFRNLMESTARVDTLLYASYQEVDLRKGLFFSLQDDGYHSFTGDYSRSNAEKFDGITTAEMHLVRAECLVRADMLQDAIDRMKLFYNYRYREGDISNVILPQSKDELLKLIIQERRKELIGRGLRWLDVRRLSFESKYAVDMVRVLGVNKHTLDAEQIKTFAYSIPQSAIELGNL